MCECQTDSRPTRHNRLFDLVLVVKPKPVNSSTECKPSQECLVLFHMSCPCTSKSSSTDTADPLNVTFILVFVGAIKPSPVSENSSTPPDATACNTQLMIAILPKVMVTKYPWGAAFPFSKRAERLSNTCEIPSTAGMIVEVVMLFIPALEMDHPRENSSLAATSLRFH